MKEYDLQNYNPQAAEFYIHKLEGELDRLRMLNGLLQVEIMELKLHPVSGIVPKTGREPDIMDNPPPIPPLRMIYETDTKPCPEGKPRRWYHTLLGGDLFNN